FVILRHHLDEFGHHVLPEFEDVTAAIAARVAQVTFDHGAHLGDLLRVVQFLQRYHGRIAASRELPRHVEHISDAARHARGKVASGSSQYHHATACHVFAAVIADRLDDRLDAAVAHAKPFAGHAADVRLAARYAVKRDVAGDDVLLRHKRGTLRGIKDDLSAAQSLAEVIIGVALELQRHAARHERAQALPGAAGKGEM